MSIGLKDLFFIKIKIIFVGDLITTLFYNEKNIYISCDDGICHLCVCTDKESFDSW